MNPIEASLLVAVLVLPFHFLANWYFARLTDPRYLREQGVVIRREEVLESRHGVIGTFKGREIYAEVTFMGMRYRFDRVVAPSYRSEVGRRELFLEPGLVYLTD